MKKLITVSIFLLAATPFFAVVCRASPQVVRPPYILGRNDERIKCKNFLAGRKPYYGAKFQIYDNRKPGGASIEFDKKTNEFEIVTGAANSLRSIQLAKQELRSAAKVLLTITGVATDDKCKLKVLMRIVVPGTTDGGLSFDHLPSCGEF
jgi:hypothetical protein